MRSILALLVALAATSAAPGAREADRRRALFLVGVPAEPGWQDFAYLAAVAAASHRCGGCPAVLAVPPSGRIGREAEEYIRRYRPEETFALGGAADANSAAGLKCTALPGETAAEVADTLVSRFWAGKVERVVACSPDNYAAALLAASVAARLDCPLLYRGRAGKAHWPNGTRTILAVGDVPVQADGRNLVRVAGVIEAARWLTGAGIGCDYLAAVNAQDRSGTVQTKLSLIGPLLAAARGGLAVPLDHRPHWMRRWETRAVQGDRPGGIPAGKGAVHAGRATLGEREVGFAIASGEDARKPGQRRVYVDRDGDGDFADAGEGPFRSADAVEVGGQRYSLVAAGPDRRNKKREVTLLTATPPAEEVRGRLAAVRRAAGGAPRSICIVGHPDAVPFWLVPDAPEAGTFVESDVPYAQADDDPFFELAVGRIIAENVRFASLHASRLITYRSLLNPRWSRSVGFARWENSLGPQFANVGFETQYVHTRHDRAMAPDAKGKPRPTHTFEVDSPLIHVAAIVHGSHSWWRELGETYARDANVLLSPCVVESAGCGTTALLPEKRFPSVISRLFRNGAVAFVGNAVPAPAPHQELRYAFWRSVFDGASLGEAHRDALNRKMLTVLEADQLKGGGVDRRTLIARHLYGDPAFRMHLPADRRWAPARTALDGDKLTVLGPQRWYIVRIRVPEDWKPWRDRPLFVLRAPGVHLRAQWCGDSYDREDIFTDVALTTRRGVRTVRQLTDLPKPLGWSGRYFVDDNADGTRTVRWRVRLADFDQVRGRIRAKADRIEYRIEYGSPAEKD